LQILIHATLDTTSTRVQRGSRAASGNASSGALNGAATGDRLAYVLDDGSTLDGRGVAMKLHSTPGSVRQVQSHGTTVMLGGSGPITKDDRLLQAAQKGDLAKVKKLLKGGVNPDFVCKNAGVTSLFLAAEFNFGAVIKALVTAKATVDATGRRGETPLMIAVQFEALEAVQVLCAASADVNRRSIDWVSVPRDASPLDIAARHNRKAAMEILLAHKVKVNDTSTEGWTALHVATSAGSVDVCARLLQVKADPLIATAADGVNAMRRMQGRGPDDAMRKLFVEHCGEGAVELR